MRSLCSPTVIAAPSTSARRDARARFLPPRAPFIPPPIVDPSTVISELATAILKTPLVLKSHRGVRCEVDAPMETALSGGVRSVRITGRRWASPRNLTCDGIEFVVGACRIDLSAALAMRGIVLERPATGTARLSFDSSDFGNFLTHPLTREAARGRFAFDNTDARVVDSDHLELTATWLEDENAKSPQRFALRPGSTVGSVDVDADGVVDSASSRAMKRFFETLVVDLEGTELRYKSMRIDGETVEFELDLTVNRFPSPNVRF